MTSIARRLGVLVGAAAMGATACSALTVTAVPASAATAPADATPADVTNPCKVVKRSEIQKVFGGIVSTGKVGPATPASSQCQYTVSADGDRPTGTVTVRLTTTRAQAAYDTLEESSAYDPIDGVPHALSAAERHVVAILHGDVLLGVQGAFTIANPLPIHRYDDAAQLTQLAQVGAERV
jgi:hypothetical protein